MERPMRLDLTRTVPAALLLLATAPLLPSMARASVLGSAAGEILDLTPDRVAAFRHALQEFSGTEISRDHDGLYLHAEYVTPSFLFGPDDDFRMGSGPSGRDLEAEEALLIEGREDAWRDASRAWVERRLKGDDSSAPTGSSWSPRLGWNGGPTVGLSRGPMSASLGSSGWRLKWTHGIRGLPGWRMRASVGEEDGDTQVGFSIGRSLLTARSR